MSEGNERLSLGKRLHEAREASGISVEDMADSLRISPVIIEMLESDAYEPEKMTVFVRGYIRAYARLVKISPKEIEQAFEELGITEKTKDSKPAKIDVKQTTIKDKPVKLTTYVIIGILVLLVFVWWYSHHTRANNSVVSPIVRSAPVVESGAEADSPQPLVVAKTTDNKQLDSTTKKVGDVGSQSQSVKVVPEKSAKVPQHNIQSLTKDDLLNAKKNRSGRWSNPDATKPKSE
jgi:cytoskeleton protein RodZ